MAGSETYFIQTIKYKKICSFGYIVISPTSFPGLLAFLYLYIKKAGSPGNEVVISLNPIGTGGGGIMTPLSFNKP